MKKTTQFKRLLHSDQVEFLMEAHNGLSAKIVEEAGFKGIWGSGLAISAALDVRDSNEASWTQILEVVEFMSDATTIPILLDADTGYGNFNSVRRLVRKLEQREVAAVCIEDKFFPKTNSFIAGEEQALANIEEFSGKIKAAKDTQQDPDFCVVARTEAFIAGWGIDEALKRAQAYYRAGADAILIHSKVSKPDQVLAFTKEWKNTCPVIIVPTMYYSTPTKVFEEAGVSVVIWANHLIRACITTMQRVAKKIYNEQSLLTVEDEIVPVREIFRLQGADELKGAEQEYLPSRDDRSRVIILAASKGAGLGTLTDDKPKAMLAIKGKPILQRLTNHFNEVGIKEVIVVAGYKPEAIDVPGVKLLINKDYAKTKELYTLATALDYLDRQTFVSFGDILFKKYILLNMQNEPGDIVIVVDADYAREHVPTRYTDFVRCTRPFTMDYFEDPVRLLEMNHAMLRENADGEWIGLIKLSREGAKLVQQAIRELSTHADFKNMRMKDLFMHMIMQDIPIQVIYVKGHWLDIDDLEILPQAMEF